MGGGSQVACLNFKTFCVGVYKTACSYNCRLCRHCHNLAEGGCRNFILRAVVTFWADVACRNLPWQGLRNGSILSLL